MAHKIAALLICDAAATGPDGKFTLYGLFDVIGCHKLPLRYPQFTVYWKLLADRLGKISVRIEKPDGSPLLSLDPFELQKNPFGKHQGVYTLTGVEFPVSGDYKVLLLLNDTEEIESTTLTIQKVGPMQ
jgi:hypothetical protein